MKLNSAHEYFIVAARGMIFGVAKRVSLIRLFIVVEMTEKHGNTQQQTVNEMVLSLMEELCARQSFCIH